MTVLRTKRLVLRRAEAGDGAALFPVFSDPVAMKFWSHLPHDHVSQTEGWIAAMMRADPARLDDFIVTLDGAPIGKCGAWDVPEIGLVLDRAHWRQGYGREALVAVIDHLFATRDLPELTADIDPENEGSLALFEGLGFRRTGYAENKFQLGDRWCHSVYLALARADWQAQFAGSPRGAGRPKR